MKLDKAIEILTSLEKTLAPTMAASGTDAIKLGIEAMNRVQLARKDFGYIDPSLLPGETEE